MDCWLKCLGQKENIHRQNLGGSERVVMDTLGIDVDATDGDNLKSFKRMNNETDESGGDEVRYAK